MDDLCRGHPEPERAGSGRKPHLVRDSVIGMTYKVYSTVSGRRFNLDLQDTHAWGYLVNPVPGLTAAHFMERAEFGPLLVELIRQSALPLWTIETDFAPDSAGFSTSRYVRWFDEKYGIQR